MLLNVCMVKIKVEYFKGKNCFITVKLDAIQLNYNDLFVEGSFTRVNTKVSQGQHSVP